MLERGFGNIAQIKEICVFIARKWRLLVTEKGKMRMSKAEELYNQKRYAFNLDEAVEHAKEAAAAL